MGERFYDPVSAEYFVQQSESLAAMVAGIGDGSLPDELEAYGPDGEAYAATSCIPLACCWRSRPVGSAPLPDQLAMQPSLQKVTANHERAQNVQRGAADGEFPQRHMQLDHS